jgi:hypothetical protein
MMTIGAKDGVVVLCKTKHWTLHHSQHCQDLNRHASLMEVFEIRHHPCDQSTHCSKLAGLFAVVFLVNLLCFWAGTISGGIEVGWDGTHCKENPF